MESGQDDALSASKSWLPKFLRRGNNSEEAVEDERNPLLPKPDDEEQGDVYEFQDGEKSKWHVILLEFWILFRGSIPVILAYTLQNSLQTVSVLIVGRLSPEALGTAAFAYMFAMATGWLIALGGTTAIDTLASATFTGSKDKTDLGVILQRSFIVLFLFYVPVRMSSTNLENRGFPFHCLRISTKEVFQAEHIGSLDTSILDTSLCITERLILLWILF